MNDFKNKPWLGTPSDKGRFPCRIHSNVNPNSKSTVCVCFIDSVTHESLNPLISSYIVIIIIKLILTE